MTTKFLSSLFLAAAAAMTANVHGAVLNLPYEAAYRYGDSCNYSLQEGARNILGGPDGGFCWLAIALPIEAGRTIKQITIYHGTEGNGPSSISAFLGYKDLRALPVNNGFVFAPLAEWESTADIVDAGMGSGNLMLQFGAPPLVSYPDAFVVSPYRAYFVRVTISQQSEFFGLRVLYE
jgi:hypothetical protein